MSHHCSHTHCQAPQAQAQTKACQRVCLPQPSENFKIFLPLFKEKIKTLQRTTYPDKEGINESIDKFNMKVQFDSNTRRDKNAQLLTSGIKNCRDSSKFKGCSPLQLLCYLTGNRPQSATFHTANRYAQAENTTNDTE